MRTIFYVGMFMTLFVLGLIMIKHSIKDIENLDLILLSIMLSLGITLMYIGQFG